MILIEMGNLDASGKSNTTNMYTIFLPTYTSSIFFYLFDHNFALGHLNIGVQVGEKQEQHWVFTNATDNNSWVTVHLGSCLGGMTADRIKNT